MNPPCRIEMLGGLRVRQGDRLIARFQTQKTGALIAYLALHSGRSFPREAMAELLWPDGDASAIRNRLNQAISSLRRQLHPPGCEPGYVLQADHMVLQINPATVVTDVAEFEAALRAAEGNPDTETQHLRQAVDLCQGEFLDGYYEEWALLERVRLSDLYYDALSRLIRAYAQSGRISAAIEVAIRRLAIDPSDERAHRALMRLYLAAGRPRSALAQYQELSRALALDEEVPSARAERLRDEALATLHEGDSELEVASIETQITDREDSVASVPRRTLPRYLTRLWGRSEELTAIEEHWQRGDRLITLTGIGGIGKTRLAVEAAWNSSSRFGDRVAFISMADHDAEQSLVAAAANVVVPSQADAPMEALGYWTQHQPSLLVLDNLERVGDGALAEFASAHARLPELFVLATSWHPLGLDGEHVVQIRPLPIPDEACKLAELAANPAIALFVDRAQAARQDFQLTERTADAIYELCRRLEGVPLALELAGSWARTLTAGQMVEQMAERFDRLTSRRKDLAPRHRSMRAVVDGSYRMLPEPCREVFARLSVFVGGWDHAAAAQVCPGTDVFDTLRTLEEFGLISSTPTDGVSRFTMLETVRTYGRDQLTPDLAAEVGNAHADYYAALAARATRREGLSGLPQIAVERANCIAAFRHMILAGRYEDAATLGCDLALYWDAAGRVSEGESVLGALAPFMDELSLGAQGLLLARQAQLAWRMGAYERARQLNEQATTIFTETDDLERLSETRLQLALEAHRNAEFAQAESILRESIEAIRGLDDPASEARHLLALGNALVEQRQWEQAVAVYDESLRLARNLGRPFLAAMPLANLGYLELLRGKPESGLPLLEEARVIFANTGFQVYERDCRRMLAQVQRLRGHPEVSLDQCRRLLAELTDEVAMIWSVLVEAANCFQALDDHATAAKLHGVVESMWESTATNAFGVEADAIRAAKDELIKVLGHDAYHDLNLAGRRLDTAGWRKLVGTT